MYQVAWLRKPVSLAHLNCSGLGTDSSLVNFADSRQEIQACPGEFCILMKSVIRHEQYRNSASVFESHFRLPMIEKLPSLLNLSFFFGVMSKAGYLRPSARAEWFRL
jgi:hypothetical protein